MHRAHNHAEPVANQHSLRFIIRPEQGAWERAVDFTHSVVSDNATFLPLIGDEQGDYLLSLFLGSAFPPRGHHK